MASFGDSSYKHTNTLLLMLLTITLSFLFRLPTLIFLQVNECFTGWNTRFPTNRQKEVYTPLQQSNTHIQAARDMCMAEVSFTLPSLLSRLVYSDFVSCLLYISFKTHVQSTKHFLVHRKISCVCVCVCVWNVAQRYCTCDSTSGC